MRKEVALWERGAGIVNLECVATRKLKGGRRVYSFGGFGNRVWTGELDPGTVFPVPFFKSPNPHQISCGTYVFFHLSQDRMNVG